MIGLALASIKSQLTVLSSDTGRYEGTTTSYAGLLNRCLRPYATSTVIVMIDYKTEN